ncbi:sensor histidine kinase [Microbacterium sp. ASV49]|uniref:histidine kinase n=1 Tax=Microbacterium candidum TaxID=3041922 RepID=A0ABT7N0Z2_9MICO|nr:PAS domain-containing sensor histidine kinase [Microbacterium sp. ASV49]MDL9980376.1 histidine kinase N-terminal domain-containing protein [Microbacterium sp. ASV49]
MSTLSDLVYAQGLSSAPDVEWLHRLAGDGQLLADLAFADIVVWVPTADDSFIAVAHTRPGGAATLFYRDIVGERVRPQWRAQVKEAFATGEIVDSASPDWFEETPTRVRAVPIVRERAKPGERTPVIGVLTRHTNLGEIRTPSRAQITFNECADELFGMIASGDFPDMTAPTSPRRGAPRASDGLIRVDAEGVTTFASPNALSAFNRMGFDDELEGEPLIEIITRILPSKRQFDESLPLVATGRAPWRSDVEAQGVTVALRAIPLRNHGTRTGAIVLCRDVSELRHREQELITKDATIREIHHRVKNNLQTVASLLRIQARRTHSEEAREALTHAMRRVSAIAVVHDTLSEGLAQNVDFDEVFARVLKLVAEVAAGAGTHARTRTVGKFGTLPSEYATPLSLALTELVTNAVEHGLAGTEGEVVIEADRTADHLAVSVRDNGVGLPEGHVGQGLGTQIVRTLIQGELGGTIDWQTLVGNGTEVTIDIPLRYIDQPFTEQIAIVD